MISLSFDSYPKRGTISLPKQVISMPTRIHLYQGFSKVTLMTTTPPRSSRAVRTLNNTVFNVIGWFWPIVLNFATVPYFVQKMGDEAFGVFILILTVVGYLALLNLGLNTASTKFISEYLAKNDTLKLNQVIVSTLMFYTVVGSVGLLLMIIASPWITTNLLNVSPELTDAAITALQLGGIGFFINMVTGAFSAVPTALQRFEITNFMLITSTTLATASTFAALVFAGGLIEVVAYRVLVSVVSLIISVIIAKRLIPTLRFRVPFSWAVLRQMITFGGFNMVTQITGLILFQTGRFVVGAYMGAASVTYYAVVADLVTRLHGFISSISLVIFPLASELSAKDEHTRLSAAYMQLVKYNTLIACFIYLAVIVFGNDVLVLWMGREFMQRSDNTLPILGIAFLVMSFNVIPYHVLNGIGKPALTTITEFSGSIFNIVLWVLLIPILGIKGAALASLIAMARVPLYVFLVNRRYIAVSNHQMLQKAYLRPAVIVAAIVVILSVIHLPGATVFELFLSLAIYSILFVILVFVTNALNYDDRALFGGYISHLLQSRKKFSLKQHP